MKKRIRVRCDVKLNSCMEYRRIFRHKRGKTAENAPFSSKFLSNFFAVAYAKTDKCGFFTILYLNFFFFGCLGSNIYAYPCTAEGKIRLRVDFSIEFEDIPANEVE